MDLWGVLAALASACLSLVPSGPWADRLNALDAARNRAYVHADAAALRSVYLPGSRALRADRRSVLAYERRGLELDRVSMQLLDLQVQSRNDGRVRLRVVDRLRPVRVRGPGGDWRALPVDEPTAHVIVLRHTPRGWRIARVTRIAG